MTSPSRLCATVALAATMGIGCTGSPHLTPDAGGACSPAPTTCPNTVPSYQGELAAVFQNTCHTCHSPSGPGTPALATYEEIHLNGISALGQVAACLMPPPDAGALSPMLRADLMAWLVCGSPDN